MTLEFEVDIQIESGPRKRRGPEATPVSIRSAKIQAAYDRQAERRKDTRANRRKAERRKVARANRRKHGGAL